MDNEQLLDRVQILLLSMEERINSRFEAVDRRFEAVDGRFDGMDRRFDALETKVDSMSREVALHNKLLAPFINWSHQIEDEVIRLSAQLQDMEARLRKLENPPAH